MKKIIAFSILALSHIFSAAPAFAKTNTQIVEDYFQYKGGSVIGLDLGPMDHDFVVFFNDENPAYWLSLNTWHDIDRACQAEIQTADPSYMAKLTVGCIVQGIQYAIADHHACPPSNFKCGGN